MTRTKAEEEQFERLQRRARAVGYEIVETKAGFQMAIIAPDAKVPDPRELGETSLDVLELWIDAAELK